MSCLNTAPQTVPEQLTGSNKSLGGKVKGIITHSHRDRGNTEILLGFCLHFFFLFKLQILVFFSLLLMAPFEIYQKMEIMQSKKHNPSGSLSVTWFSHILRVCVWGGGVWGSVSTSVSGKLDNLWCHSLGLYFVRLSVLPGAHWVGLAVCQVVPACLHLPGAGRTSTHNSLPLILRQFLMLAWHTLYWLSCLPSPGWSEVIEHLSKASTGRSSLSSWAVPLLCQSRSLRGWKAGVLTCTWIVTFNLLRVSPGKTLSLQGKSVRVRHLTLLSFSVENWMKRRVESSHLHRKTHGNSQAHSVEGH